MANRDIIWQFIQAYYKEHKVVPLHKTIVSEGGFSHNMVAMAMRVLIRDGFIRRSINRKTYILLR